MPPKPPLAKTAKIDIMSTLVGQSGIFAHNILYVSSPGSSDQIPPSSLASIANAVVGTTAPTGWRRFLTSLGSNWQFSTVTVSDNGGSTAVTTSAPALTGTATSASYPPQCAVCLSWSVNARYRGGKPRTYFPGIPQNSTGTSGGSGLTATYATNLKNAANSFLNDINGTNVDGLLLQLGTISYYQHKVPRPSPVFVPYIGVHVHERLDSQRRRSGREATYPVA